MTRDELDTPGLIFDVDTFAVHDGPGIRMAVYFKGCPLRCRWCHSPESQASGPEIILVADRCSRCGRCVQACRAGAHTVTADVHTLDRTRCRACGECLALCPTGALALKGTTVSAGVIVGKASRMEAFFRHSGGGITLTGGEVTQQPDFACAILRGCRDRHIHTVMETCGACDWPVLQRLGELCDLILYDLKIVDEQAHRRWTGASNKRILANVRRLARGPQTPYTAFGDPRHGQAGSVTIRLPLIPGITDTPQNIGDVSAFVRDAGLRRLELLPYNPFSGAKYEWLGRRYEIAGEIQSTGHLQALLSIARQAGLEADIG